MNALERVGWWFSGETSRIIAEEYDDRRDAMIMPIITTGLSWLLAHESGTLFGSGVLHYKILGVLGLGLSLLIALFAFLSTMATYQYASQPMQDVQVTEVSA